MIEKSTPALESLLYSSLFPKLLGISLEWIYLTDVQILFVRISCSVQSFSSLLMLEKSRFMNFFLAASK